MSRLTIRLLLLAGLAGLLCLCWLSALYVRDRYGAQIAAAFARKRPPDTAEIIPILMALRKGDAQGAGEAWARLEEQHKGEPVFEDWLGTVLIKGQTTHDEATSLLGPHFQYIGRPPRDGLVTVEYYFGGDTWLFLDFDARTRVLRYWGVSRGVCGFCPHVFAYDGQWRLEGKLLAGCIGRHYEGPDTLVLPRLVIRHGRLRLKVSNLAPEVEYLDQILLGAVPLREAEELDVGSDGQPIAWRPLREIEGGMQPGHDGQDELRAELGPAEGARVLVVEVRNTSAFETVMRASLSGTPMRPEAAAVRVQLGDGPARDLPAVGTKFLRRVVVPLPPGSGTLRLSARRGWWLVSRLWVGEPRTVEGDVLWRTPSAAQGPVPDACRLLQSADQQRVRLERGQELELTFPAPEPAGDSTRWGYVVRMTGYYDFLPAPRTPASASAHP